jgi:mannose-6-phosphate isomerase-like protein (cupin superfamily)
MRLRNVPVTMGSPLFQDSDFGAYTLTEAWFPPHVELEPHTHPRAIFAVMIEGSFTNHIAGREYDCTPGSFWTEPLGERHSNRGGRAGARVFVVQPAPASMDTFESFTSLLSQVHWGRDGTATWRWTRGTCSWNCSAATSSRRSRSTRCCRRCS